MTKKIASQIIQQHAFRQPENNSAASQKAFRSAVLADPRLQLALARYINSLNLQGQINNGLDPNHALKLMHNAATDFVQHIHSEIDKIFVKNKLDQTDLSNPLNMQMALNNPNSYANQMLVSSGAMLGGIQDPAAIAYDEMVNLVAQLTAEIEEATQNNLQQQAMDEASEEQATTEAEEEAQPQSNEVEEGTAIAAALETVDDMDVTKGEKMLEDIFHKVTGQEKGSFEEIKDEAQSLVDEVTKNLSPTLKPNAVKKDIDEDED